jgi:hypothetical protein
MNIDDQFLSRLGPLRGRGLIVIGETDGEVESCCVIKQLIFCARWRGLLLTG